MTEIHHIKNTIKWIVSGWPSVCFMTTKYSSAQTLLFFLKRWAWQVQVLGYDSSSFLQRTKWIVEIIQLERDYKIESNSTCIHVKQLPIFPQGWRSKDCQVGLVVLYFSSSLFSCFISSIQSTFSRLRFQPFLEHVKYFSFSIVHGFL